MKSMEYIEHHMDINRKLRKAIIFGATTAGIAAGAYIGTRKIIELIEDKRLARYYEDEIDEIFQDKEKMKFYEDEFIRQEEKEKEDLEKAVKEFNSRRLRRDESPHSSDNIENEINSKEENNTSHKTMDRYDV